MDYKDLLTFNLSTLVKKYKKCDRFKATAYSKALSQLPSSPILSFNDVANVGGDKTKQKMKYMIENNKNLEEVDDYINDNSYTIIDTLQTIHGPAKAQELHDKHNIRSIDDLKQNTDLLNNIQKTGLDYYDDIQRKIPYKEMIKHEQFLTAHLQQSNTEFGIAGSYRRKSPQSSDIDVLITGTTNKLTDVVCLLQKLKYINSDAVFANGEVKFMGLCKLPRHKVFRRIDILYTTRREYPFALLYFTGNYKFNVDMRKHALSRGYSLNEQGMKSLDGEPIDHLFSKEEDIFEFLEYPYTKPEERVV